MSVVTPSLNAGPFLRSCVRSVQSQDAGGRLADAGGALEYVIRDAGSTDGSAEILDEAEAAGARVIREPDGGQSDAIARGFAETSGEIMAWLNADDVYAPGALAWAVRMFRERPEAQFIYGHRTIIDEHGRVTGHWRLPEHRDGPQAIRAMLPQESCFWRRGLYDAVGGIDTSYSFAFDHELFVRMMRDARSRSGDAGFLRIDAWPAAFRIHAAAKTSTQYATVGRAELARLKARHGIPTGLLAAVRGRVFRERVRVVSLVDGRQPGDEGTPQRVERGEMFALTD